MLVAKRAKQLIKGGAATLSSKENKKIVLALREVAHGSVAFSDFDERRALEQISKDLKK
jgi:DNA-directed RNA polymerase subunit K/omega